MTDKGKALDIWLCAATKYDFLSANTPREDAMHAKDFEEQCGWMFNPDGSYTAIVETAYMGKRGV